MKKLLTLTALVVAFWPLYPAQADPLVWSLPGGFGQIGLPFQSTELLLGYDAVLNQGVGGVSLPVYQAPHNIIAVHLGACGAYPTQAANTQPYIAVGHDIARDIPILSQFQSLHINGFARYAADQGKIGAGGTVSWSFGGSTPTSTATAELPASYYARDTGQGPF